MKKLKYILLLVPLVVFATTFSDQVVLESPYVATTTPVMVFTPSYTLPNNSPPVRYIDISPNLIINSGAPVIGFIHVGGNETSTASPILYTFNSVISDRSFISNTPGVAPFLPDTFFDNYYVEYSAPNSSATTQYLPISNLDFGTVAVKNGASLKIGNAPSLLSAQSFNATGVGSFLETPMRSAVEVRDLNKNQSLGGVVQVDKQAGMYVHSLSNALQNFSIYSEGTSTALFNAGMIETGTPTRGGCILLHAASGTTGTSVYLMADSNGNLYTSLTGCN